MKIEHNIGMKDYWWQLWPQSEPLNSTKCVALYSDGSGSFFFYVDDKGEFRDPEDNEIMCKEFFDESVSHWTYLPNGFKFWEEIENA